MSRAAKKKLLSIDRRMWQVAAVIALIGAGLALRFIAGSADSIVPGLQKWLPWLNQTTITLYFPADEDVFVPVSRSVSDDEATPRGLLDALLADPNPELSVARIVPADTRVLSYEEHNGLVRVDLAGDLTPQILLALRWSLLSHPDVEEVDLSVDDALFESTAHPLYVVHDGQLIAVPVTAETPRDMLEIYRQISLDPAYTGLPPDVQLLDYAFDSGNGLLKISLAFTPALRQFATDDPETMRLALIGLIATLTDYSQVHAVLLDFEGHTTLGLGQCSYLLRAPQTRPTVLNDERLMLK